MEGVRFCGAVCSWTGLAVGKRFTDCWCRFSVMIENNVFFSECAMAVEEIVPTVSAMAAGKKVGSFFIRIASTDSSRALFRKGSSVGIENQE